MSTDNSNDPGTAIGPSSGHGTGIDHIGIAVHDLDESIAMYTKSFGLRLIAIEDNKDQRVREAMLSAGNGPPYVQLVAPLDSTSTVAKFLAERKPGLHHLAFAVDDIEDAATKLQESGVPVLYEAPRPGSGDTRINFVHPRDAGGTLIELVQNLERPSVVSTDETVDAEPA